MELERTMSVAEAAYAVVALDGSGTYTTIAAAVKDATHRRTRRHSIFIKGGVYNLSEPIVVEGGMRNLTLAGEGINATVISGDRSFGHGYATNETGSLKFFLTANMSMLV